MKAEIEIRCELTTFTFNLFEVNNTKELYKAIDKFCGNKPWRIVKPLDDMSEIALQYNVHKRWTLREGWDFIGEQSDEDLKPLPTFIQWVNDHESLTDKDYDLVKAFKDCTRDLLGQYKTLEEALVEDFALLHCVPEELVPFLDVEKIKREHRDYVIYDPETGYAWRN